MSDTTNNPPAWINTTLDYKGFRIVVKRDFGSSPFLIDGMPCIWGYVVTYGPGMEYAGCNAMPGATWFQTVREAKDAIDTHIAVGGEKNSDAFWSAWQERKRAINDAREQFLARLTSGD